MTWAKEAQISADDNDSEAFSLKCNVLISKLRIKTDGCASPKRTVKTLGAATLEDLEEPLLLLISTLRCLCLERLLERDRLVSFSVPIPLAMRDRMRAL